MTKKICPFCKNEMEEGSTYYSEDFKTEEELFLLCIECNFKISVMHKSFYGESFYGEIRSEKSADKFLNKIWKKLTTDKHAYGN